LSREKSILRYYQSYLLVKLFVYLPNRSQEPRQYVEGKTLFRELDEQNEYRYFAKNIKHKNQRYDGLRHYPLPSILTADIDTWLRKYRPRVEWALQSLENWLKFWGQEPGQLEKVQQRLEAAYQGVFSRQVKNKQAYISRLERGCKELQNRIDSYPIAKAAFEESNSVFFHFGFSHSDAFGKPLSSQGVYNIIQSSVAEASKAVLDKIRWTSPHRFRHIAEDQANNPEFSEVLNHNSAMGEEYRKQIAKRSIRHRGVVDDWWKKSKNHKYQN
jgi:integrase